MSLSVSELLKKLVLPVYSLSFSDIIYGHRNFGYSYDVSLPCSVDKSIIDKKLSLWDYVLEHDLLNHPNELVRARSSLLLRDKSIMLYNFMRLNGHPVRPYWSQDVVLSDVHDRVIFCGANQVLGKEQPYSSLILTPSGYVPMGTLNIGDTVYGSDGNECKVLKIFEQGVKDVYRLTFNDGSSVECGLEHLWKIVKPTHLKQNSSHYMETSILSLKQIISLWGMMPSEWNRLIIPRSNPVNFSHKQYSLPPYLIGVILGDGCLSPLQSGRSGSCGRLITIHPDDREIIDKISSILPNGLIISKCKKGKYGWRITANGKHLWKKLFNSSGLKEVKCHEKFVPSQYLLGDVTQRTELLRGLLDTDGSITKGRIIEFSSKSKQLVDDVSFLVESLGGSAIHGTKNSSYTKYGVKHDCGIHYRLRIKLENLNPFYLTRKRVRYRNLYQKKNRVLRSIKLVRQEQSRCIMVNSPDNTYLTNHCIMTHNSSCLDFDASTEFLIDHKKRWVCLLISGSMGQSMERMSNIKLLLNSMNLKYKQENVSKDSRGKSNATQISFYFLDKKGKPKYENLLICCPFTSSALGYAADYVLCLSGKTFITTDKGNFLIKDIVEKKLDVKILSYNHKTKKLEFKKILRYNKNKLGNRKLLNFFGLFIGTSKHKVYTDKGYVQLKDVTKKQSLFILSNKHSYYENKIRKFKTGWSNSKAKKHFINQATKTNSLWERFRGWLFSKKKTYIKCSFTINKFNKTERLFFMEKRYVKTFYFIIELWSKLVQRIYHYACKYLCIKRVNRNLLVNTKNNKKIFRFIESSWFSNLVYGRWLSSTIKQILWFMYSQIFIGRKQNNTKLVFRKIWYNFKNICRQTKRFIFYFFFFKRKRFILEDYIGLYTSINELQNKKDELSLLSKRDIISRSLSFLFNRLSNIKKKIKPKKTFTEKEEYVYDLTIEDNHNYFANNVLVHNCDELDFWEDVKGGQQHFINQVIIPRTFKTEGKIKCYSNPYGKERAMYWLFNQTDDDGNPAWHRYHFNFWDCSNPSQKKFDKYCIGRTRAEIDSTLLAKFTSTSGTYFSTDEISGILDKGLCEKGDSAGYGRETVWFLDVGTVHDQSVLCGAYITENVSNPDYPYINLFYIHKYPVGYPLSRVIGVPSAISSDDGWNDYVDDNPSVKDVLDRYSETYNGVKYQPLFGYDVTGNRGLITLMDSAGIESIDITFSGKHKWSMYQHMKYFIENGLLRRSYERDNNMVRGCNFDYQFSKITIRKGTRTAYKQLHHENENDLDDIPDCVAGLVWLIVSPDTPSLSFDYIESLPISEQNLNSSSDIYDKHDKIDESVLDGQYIPSFMDKRQVLDLVKNNRENV